MKLQKSSKHQESIPQQIKEHEKKIKRKGQITTYLSMICPKFKLPTYGLKFNTYSLKV